MIEEHFAALADSASRAGRYARSIDSWGRRPATVLESGGRLPACGDDGRAAEVQHPTGELAGRFLYDRRPCAAIPLHADHSACTAILNDYGEQEVFARGVRAHGRPGDVPIALSTSERGQNVITAEKTAHEIGMSTWALTGPAMLAAVCDEAVAVQAPSPATVQEMHLALIHALCAVFDVAGSRREEGSAVR
ncbi:SIS domain-containing protein [Saccharopolyspora erythraea]|uniref:D-sedoheptulose-7-phosphate isomerase n=1 Tax=Saccharopolyspora erythraea TaxID=1836 RepID=UPI001BAB0B4F|nr:SIS domain-containing protein [Saccharopolyspora erythraea]QUH00648.1 SIS domain-containing protein [Saccharopolyspora erythraea]